jgi:hypothetical protein
MSSTTPTTREFKIKARKAPRQPYGESHFPHRDLSHQDFLGWTTMIEVTIDPDRIPLLSRCECMDGPEKTRCDTGDHWGVIWLTIVSPGEWENSGGFRDDLSREVRSDQNQAAYYLGNDQWLVEFWG